MVACASRGAGTGTGGTARPREPRAHVEEFGGEPLGGLSREPYCSPESTPANASHSVSEGEGGSSLKTLRARCTGGCRERKGGAPGV